MASLARSLLNDIPSLNINPNDDSSQMSTCKTLVQKVTVQSIQEARSLAGLKRRRREDNMGDTLPGRNVCHHTGSLPATKRPNLRGELTKFSAAVCDLEVGKEANEAVNDIVAPLNAAFGRVAKEKGLSPADITDYLQQMLPYMTAFMQEITSLKLTPAEHKAFTDLMEATNNKGFNEFCTLMKEDQQYPESVTSTLEKLELKAHDVDGTNVPPK